MSFYRATTTVGTGGISPGDMNDISDKLTEAIRQVGYLIQITHRDGLVIALYDIEADDLWDLRIRIEEIEHEVACYGFNAETEKPEVTAGVIGEL